MKRQGAHKEQGCGTIYGSKCGEGIHDPHTSLWFGQHCMTGAKPTPSWCHLSFSCPFHQICILHMRMGIVQEFVQAPNCYFHNMYQPYLKQYH